MDFSQSGVPAADVCCQDTSPASAVRTVIWALPVWINLDDEGCLDTYGS